MIKKPEILWPSWSGNEVKSKIPCPACDNKTTSNFAGTLNPEGRCSYRCDCGVIFDVQNKNRKVSIQHPKELCTD